MPRVDGIEVLRRLQKYPNHPKVIMLTGIDEVRIAMECLELGADDCLTKPCQWIHLCAVVQRVLNSELWIDLARSRRQY